MKTKAELFLMFWICALYDIFFYLSWKIFILKCDNGWQNNVLFWKLFLFTFLLAFTRFCFVLFLPLSKFWVIDASVFFSFHFLSLFNDFWHLPLPPPPSKTVIKKWRKTPKKITTPKSLVRIGCLAIPRTDFRNCHI